MQFLKSGLKYSLLIFLLFAQSLIFANANSLQEIKDKIIENGLTTELLSEYEFYIRNNKVDAAKEINFLENQPISFETQYLLSLIQFRNNNFKAAYQEIIQQIDKSPTYYPLYNLLVTSSRITNNQSQIAVFVEKVNSSKYKNYLIAQDAYHNAEYKKAKDFFELCMNEDSTSFDVLYSLAYTYRNLGDYNQALNYFNTASNYLAKDDPRIAKLTIAIGSLFYLSGNYNKAKELYIRGLELASSNGVNTEKIKALLNLGMIMDLEGDVKLARKHFDEAIELSSKINDNELEATSLLEYAVSLTYTDERIKAREKYQKAFELFQKLKNKNRLALTAINIGNSFLNISNYNSAIEYFEIGLNEAGENVRTQMLALRGLGDVYTNLSNYTKAIDYYEQAKDISINLKDVSATAKINIGLGILYYNLDMPQKSLDLLELSEEQLNESANPYLKLEIEQKIGIILSSVDSLLKAEEYLVSSANMAKKYGDLYSEILSNTFLAELNIKQGHLSKAKKLLNKTMKLTNSIEYYQMLGLQKVMMSRIYNASGDYKNEFKNLIEAKHFANISNDFGTLIKVNFNMGEYYKNNNKKSEAEEFYLSALNIIEYKSNMLNDKADIQIKFYSNHYEVYNSLIELYLADERFNDALTLLEKSKSRNTNFNILNHRLNLNSGNHELLNRYFDVSWKLSKNEANTEEYAILINEFEQVKLSISKKNPLIERHLANNFELSFDEIQSELNDNHYIISYFVGKKNIYAFQISNNDIKTKILNISSDKLNELKKGISPYFKNMKATNEISFNKDLFAFNTSGAFDFYQNIVEPIVSAIPVNSDIIFSLPTEMLTIPFEFLVTKTVDQSSPYSVEGNKFLINDYSISYTPSIPIWSELKNASSNDEQIALLIGDPFFTNETNKVSETRGLTDEIGLFSRSMNTARLEYSAEEISSIGSLLNNVKVFTNDQATETAFKYNANSASIIHLSTHSFLYKNNPLILFSNNDYENDGYLEVGEILDLNMNTDLVVLSSCKSGLGRVDKAEGIVGMQKAFFDAGAKSVVVTLWDVNDKYTSMLMKYFYSFLSEGYTKSESLRLAKIKFMELDNLNPYYWAAFTLSGNDSAINLKIDNNNLNIVVLIILLILLTGTSFFYRRIFLNRKRTLSV